MTLRRVIKKNAKSGLSGRWGKAILIMLIFVGINLLLSFLDNSIYHALGFRNIKIDYNLLSGYPRLHVNADPSSIGEAAFSLGFALIRLCVVVPLSLGATNWLLELTDNRERAVGDIFWAYDNIAYGRSIWLSITIAVKVWLFSILALAIPGVLLTVSDTGKLPSAASAVLLVIGLIFMLAAIPLILWFSARYFLAEMLLCDRYYYTVGEATRLSVELTRGRRWEIVGFILSFLPWYLLSALVIPAFYVVPYVKMSSVIYSRFLFEDGLMRKKKLDLHDPSQLIVDDLTPENYQQARSEQQPSAEQRMDDEPQENAKEEPQPWAPQEKKSDDDDIAQL